jgi:hypothetical protein
MKNVLLLLTLTFLLLSCNENNKKSSTKATNDAITKLAPNDPFSNTTIESEFFSISADKDTIIEGKNGTIIQIPKGALVDEQGNVITGKVKIELAELETLDDYLLSGITSESDGKLLDSKGVFYINATQDRKQLYLNENNSIYIERSIQGEKNGQIKIFNGEKREDGLIEWTESTVIEKFLIPIDLEFLDFLPKDFEVEVNKGMPFKSYESATDALIDSLYYSLEFEINEELPIISEDVDSIEIKNEFLTDSAGPPCGIQPASIRTIRSNKFNNTLIATREFENRLKVIFKSCNSSLIQLYIENSDKNLWEIDEMAASLLGEKHAQYTSFKNFASQKLTNVEKSETAEKLSKYYKSQLLKIKDELRKLKDEAEADLKQKREVAEEKRQEYKELLRKREKYRMDKFGFKLTTLGWMNGAVHVEDLEKFVLEITVNNGETYDRVHTYIVYNRIRSLFAMVSMDKINFYRGYNLDKYLLMWDGGKADAIVIAYKGDQVFFGKQEFVASTKIPALLTFDLESISNSNLKFKLRGDFWRNMENSINVDLAYQDAFNKEYKRQQRLINEKVFISRLKSKAFACCEMLMAQKE